MFRGFSSVSLDSKGRLAIPSRFRERLMEIAGGCLVQTLNPRDRSLLLYPLPEWDLIEEKLAGLSDFDRQSRRTKQMMRGYARLDKQVVILGQGNKFEIWNRGSWEEQRDQWLNMVGDEEGTPADALQSLSL